MNNPTLSIIVPVYNAEEYLRRCIDSILAQTYTDFEVICINDGSSDKSSEILEEYAKKDSRVIIINQANKGAGAARNAGLKIMRGTYVGFVDADDWIEPVMYSYMIQKLIENEVDSVVCGFKLEGNADLDPFAKQILEKFTSAITTKFDIDYKNIGGITIMVWCKLLKTEIIKKYNLEFPEGIAYEDNAFNWFYMSLSKNIMFLNKEHERFYHYFKHSSSLTYNSQEYPKILDLFTNVEKFLEHLIKYNIVYKLSPIFLSILSATYNLVDGRTPENKKVLLYNRFRFILQYVDIDRVVEIADRDNIVLFSKNHVEHLKKLNKKILYYLSTKIKNIKINIEKRY